MAYLKIVDRTLAQLSDADRRMVTQQQVLENGKVIYSGTIGNFIAAAMLTVTFYETVSWPALTIWWFIYTATVIDRLIQKNRSKTAVHNSELLDIKRRLTINAAVNANLWGAAAAGLLSIANPFQAGLLMAICAGVMGVGAVAFRCMPDATRAWLTITPVCFAIGLLYRGDLISLAATTMLIIYAYLLFENSCKIFEGFVELLLSRQEIEEGSETVKLLLNDFEEQSSNWLFALDRQGRLVDVCDRFAEAAHLPAEQLNGAALLSLFEHDGNRDSLADHLTNGRSFRDLALITDIEGKQKCWTLSARATEEKSETADPGTEDDIVLRGVIADVTARKDAEKQASYLMRFDSLTDLPNRRLFVETLNRVMYSLNDDKDGDIDNSMPDKQMALLLFDISKFQLVNDDNGHETGDKILQIIARRLSKFVGQEDTLARTGGDEFSLLLTGKHAENADKIAAEAAEHLRMAYGIKDRQIALKFSVGLAIWDGKDPNVERIIKEANLALHSAKEAGENRIISFEKGMDIAAEERRKLEHQLVSSLGNGQMQVYYQPVVNLNDRSKIGYEALVRWEHPQMGLVMPDKFIPLAEKTGVIVQLGEWVIRNAVEQAASWPNENMVAVNLSPAQMRSPSLVSTVVNSLANTGLDPSRLELEITENVLMNDSDSNLRTLHSLRSLGVRISLDDFGTGYSSLNYLRAFPFDKIKIDRCFVEEIDSREDSRAIVRSVIDLARSLGMQTTAEGVERESQAEQLIAEGCHQVQGYLYGKAAPLKPVKPNQEDGAEHPEMIEERRKKKREKQNPPVRKRA